MPREDISVQLRADEKRRIVTLCTTHDCNLRCTYCYEPTKSRDHYMSVETAKEAITYYMEADDEFEDIEIDFFGGEPMMAFDLIREVVEWFHTRPWRKGHIFFIGTNGTILTEEMKQWLVHYKDCVVLAISLDGNKVAHDLNRSNSYDQLMENLPFFLEHWSSQPLKMTISAETIPYVADSIIELEEKGWLFSANVVFENIWGTPEEKAVLLETYAQQLERLVEYYVEHPDLHLPLMLDRNPESIFLDEQEIKPVGADCIRWCGAGHEMVMVEVDGEHYPCHRFAPWITGRPAPKKTERVNRQTNWKPDECVNCQLINLCPTCAGFNWQENGDTGMRTTYHCEFVKLEVAAAANVRAQRLLRQSPEDLAKLSPEKAHQLGLRVDAILKLTSSEF